MTFAEETMELALERTEGLREQVIAEIKRLLQSGAVNLESHNRGILFGVAVENIADLWLSGERKSKEYRNLKCF